jgi:glycosyltransferase involved in cell wall biosynthesis
MRKISIGLPVYNEEKNIKKVLNNIISQNCNDKEVIISDNSSTDLTGLICKKFSKKFKFIKYYRQKKTIDIFKNYNFVLQKSKSKYFIWQAADDLRSTNFLIRNINFLEKNPSFVASTGISILDKEKFIENIINFNLSGNIYQRLFNFFKYKWVSRGIFDSVVRLDVLKRFPFNNFKNYFARDWTVILFLLSQGQINRDKLSRAYFGSKGLSFKPSTLKIQRFSNKKYNYIEAIFPFFYFTKHSIILYKNYSILTKLILIFNLFTLNLYSGFKLALKNINN